MTGNNGIIARPALCKSSKLCLAAPLILTFIYFVSSVPNRWALEVLVTGNASPQTKLVELLPSVFLLLCRHESNTPSSPVTLCKNVNKPISQNVEILLLVSALEWMGLGSEWLTHLVEIISHSGQFSQRKNIPTEPTGISYPRGKRLGELNSQSRVRTCYWSEKLKVLECCSVLFLFFFPWLVFKSSIFQGVLPIRIKVV